MLTCFSCCRVPCLCCRGCLGMIQLLRSILLNPRLVYSKDARLVHTFRLHMTHFPVCTVSSGVGYVNCHLVLPRTSSWVGDCYVYSPVVHGRSFQALELFEKMRSYIWVTYYRFGTSNLTGIFSIICWYYHGKSQYGLSTWWQWRRWGTWTSRKTGGGEYEHSVVLIY